MLHRLFEMAMDYHFEMTIDSLFEMTMTVVSRWWLILFSKWWIDFLFEMIDDFLFARLMAFSSIWRWCFLREMGLDALCCFRNDSHFSCHRRKMLCPVVFTFERIDYFEERPYIFGNDRSFRRDSFPPKTLEILSFIKDRWFCKAFALIPYLKENHRF